MLVRPVLTLATFAAIAVAAGAAGWHFYWAVGGSTGAQVVIPQREGVPAFEPGAWLTAAVDVCLLGFAALAGWVWSGDAPTWARWLLAAALVVFVLRAIGDGRQVGFSKSDHDSPFARWDDRLFTPLVTLLAFGTGATLLP